MLERAHGLTSVALEAIADLERRVVAHDGGRLKLEWNTLRSRRVDQVRNLLHWEEGRLLGFLGIYSFSASTLELTGMVDPAARGRGIGRALFDAAVPICRTETFARTLMVVPRVSAHGRTFALARGMTYDHSEHALTLTEPPEPLTDDDLTLRRATHEDVPALARLILDAFGDGDVDARRIDHGGTLMVERCGELVGALATTWNDRRAAVYGFVVAPKWRGQGIGRTALKRACRDLFTAGAESVGLEVEVTNERALGLYTSVGFASVATDDYYKFRLIDTAGQ